MTFTRSKTWKRQEKALGMITSNIAEGITPENGQLLTMWYPTSLEDVIDPEMREKRFEELWGTIRRFFPDIDEHIHWKREKALKIVDGAQINIHQTEALRPGAKVPVIFYSAFKPATVALCGFLYVGIS